jgi:hypothetical protein
MSLYIITLGQKDQGESISHEKMHFAVNLCFLAALVTMVTPSKVISNPPVCHNRGIYGSADQ